MPKELHDKLEKEADKKGLKGEDRKAYIYGTLNKIEKAKKDKEANKKRDTIKEHKKIHNNNAAKQYKTYKQTVVHKW